MTYFFRKTRPLVILGFAVASLVSVVEGQQQATEAPPSSS